MTEGGRFPSLHGNRQVQLAIGLAIGIAFGFLLQKGGVSRYDIIMGQLLLVDFTVLKLMFTAIVVGTIGIHAMRAAGLVRLHTWRGPMNGIIAGGLIFGVGFAVLGYCPGGSMAALGQGSLDALFGILGILAGTWVYAVSYPKIVSSFLGKGVPRHDTLPEALGVSPWILIIPLTVLVSGLFWALEMAGY